jgi:hypothetical protein
VRNHVEKSPNCAPNGIKCIVAHWTQSAGAGAQKHNQNLLPSACVRTERFSLMPINICSPDTRKNSKKHRPSRSG